MNKKFFYFLVTTLVTTEILIIYVLYLLFVPVNVLHIKKTPLTVITKEIKSGSNLKYFYDFCKFEDVEAKISISIIDGLIYTLPPFTSNQPPGCRKIIIQTYIPKEVEKGTYYLDITTEYQVNIFKKERFHMKTEKFKVI